MKIDAEVVEEFIGCDAFPSPAAHTVSTNTPVLHVGGWVGFWLWIIILKNPPGIIKALTTIVEDKHK